MKKIAVVGSINIDYVVETSVLPKTGETVLGDDFFLSLGGKGANQAVAASRLGGNVSLFGSIGEDENGRIILEKLQKEKVNINYIQKVKDKPTGVAFIELCKSENRIIVISGANECTDISYINRMKNDLLQHDIIIFQLETPIEMMEFIIPILYEHRKIIIVDPAPAKNLKKEILNKITYLTPNEHEYQTVFDSNESMEILLKQYPNKLIITRGSKGVTYFDGEKIVNVPSILVTPVDTTGAGDTFSGAFALAIAKGKELFESIKFGNIAAGLSVTKRGAQTGMPYMEDIEQFCKVKG
jgi:ribokinase